MLHERETFELLNFIEEFNVQKKDTTIKYSNQYQDESVKEKRNDHNDHREIKDNNNCKSSYFLSIKSKNSSRTVHLEHYLYEVGRRKDADIILKDVAVSRYHATIVKEFNPTDSRFRYKIVDGDFSGHKNTNGLLINKQFYKTKYLEHGDVISFSRNIQAKFLVVSEQTSNDNLLVDAEKSNQINKLQKTLKNYSESKQTLNSYNTPNISLLSELFGELYNNLRKIKHLGGGDLPIEVNINISTPEGQNDQSICFDSNLELLEGHFNQSKNIKHVNKDNEKKEIVYPSIPPNRYIYVYTGGEKSFYPRTTRPALTFTHTWLPCNRIYWERKIY